ncbi:histidinol-phosphatase HisJ family protein [Paenibacillus rhizovicinus]|uniref:Histidinol-phosphatase n=1 Tax=Paenibacillus rhizovicinus TaxID=2704463 RepID=A0A6C0P3B8_9BACL|nr:histidinol-phosphatase HisJ family protein [Paenibacillus rhizovicinus]QHW32323.1 histidinol-phosphatase HisJ family protein [Paenibacillus rhizovicinus]
MQVPKTIVDQHVHSGYSPDSEEPLRNIVAHAVKLGKPAVVTTDHFDYDCKFFKKDILIDMDSYEREVAELRQTHDIEIRKGIEVGYRQDYHEAINHYLERYSFDLVLLSAHNNGVVDYSEEAFVNQPMDRILTEYFSHVCEAVERMDNYDVVAHLDYVARYTKTMVGVPDYERCRSILYDLFKTIIRKEKVLELNTTGLFRQGWIHPHAYLIEMYLDLGGKRFSLGSDAHRVGSIEQGFGQALDLLKSYGIHEVVQFRNRVPQLVLI